MALFFLINFIFQSHSRFIAKFIRRMRCVHAPRNSHVARQDVLETIIKGGLRTHCLYLAGRKD
jgi:hypothetical protein